MTDRAKTSADAPAPAGGAGATGEGSARVEPAVDEFAHIRTPRTRHPLLAAAAAALAFFLVFHIRAELRYALSPSEPLDLGDARTTFARPEVVADAENRFVRVRGTPDRESGLELDTKGSWVFSQFFRVLGTGDRLFVHRRENPLPAFRAERDAFEGRLIRFRDLSFESSIRSYFRGHVTATHFFAVDDLVRALMANPGAPLTLRDLAGDTITVGPKDELAMDVLRPNEVRIGLRRERVPDEAAARLAIQKNGGEILSTVGIVKEQAPEASTASAPGPLALVSTTPVVERWTFIARFQPGERDAALSALENLDPKVAIRDARETVRAPLAGLGLVPDGSLIVADVSPGDRRVLPVASIATARTIATVDIPPDAYLVLEADQPREHLPTVLMALLLVMFGVINVVALVREIPAMSLRIYDTRSGRKVAFEPLAPGKVGLYACGITVYDDCHVGHARMMVAFDVIARHLRASGTDVRFVRNVTDVDDKIIRKGLAEGRPAAEVARHYTERMNADMRALGVDPADCEPRATEHIAEVIDIVQRLEQKGLAYAVEGDVYYTVGGFAHYGQLSGQSIDDLKAGARIEVGEHKKSPLDFALWKAAKPGEPSWDSPWGAGRPGWHIECSAMAHRYLGEPFDIHGGGADLIFPHHENEIAQSEGAFGDGQFARHWLHSGMVNFGGEKMSKSLGNVVGIRKVAETHDLEALRLLFVSVHYRSPVAFTIAPGGGGYPDLDDAEARLEYFYRTLERLDQAGLPAEPDAGPVVAPADQTAAAFREAMDDDFNTAAAVGHLYDSFVLANKLLDDPKAAAKDVRRRTLARLRRDLVACGATLGIFRRPPAEFLLARRTRLCARRGIDAAAVEARIAERVAARAAKDFARADVIRAELKERGIELMDGPAGTTWRVV